MASGQNGISKKILLLETTFFFNISSQRKNEWNECKKYQSLGTLAHWISNQYSSWSIRI